MNAFPENNMPMGAEALPPLDLSDVIGQVGNAPAPEQPMGAPMQPPMGGGAPPEMGAPSPMGAQGPSMPFEQELQPDGSTVVRLKGTQFVVDVLPPGPRTKKMMSGKPM